MCAFRFLAEDRWDPIAGLAWGDQWAELPGGLIAYPIDALHYWIAPELWQVEVGGRVVQRAFSVSADRARVVSRVGTWDHDACRAFVRWCHERWPRVTSDPDARSWESACTAGYEASQFAGMVVLAEGGDVAAAVGAERAEQLAWVRRRAGLE